MAEENGILQIAEKHSERMDSVFRETSVYFTQTNAGSYRSTLEGMLPTDKFMQEVELYIGKNFDLTEQETDECLDRMYRAVFGLHVLEPLIENRDISDIRINDWDNVRVMWSGKRLGTDVRFLGRTDLELFISRLAYRNGVDLARQPNALSLFTDRKSAGNSILRIDVQMPGLVSEGKIYAHIRKIPKEKLQMDYLIRAGMLEERQAQSLIEDYIRKGRSLLIAGKNGSGKTYLLNALLDHIPWNRSGLIVQESDELYSDHPDLRFLHIYEPPAFAKDERSFDLLDLTKMGNVSSNDVFGVGEIKGAEALYAITQSASTGCQFLATIHANNSRGAVTQLASYAKYVSDYSLDNLYEMIAGTELTCIFMKDFHVKEITAVTGWNESEKRLLFRSVYKE